MRRFKTLGNMITILFFILVIFALYFPIKEHLGVIGEGVYVFSLVSLSVVSLAEKYKKHKY